MTTTEPTTQTGFEYLENEESEAFFPFETLNYEEEIEKLTEYGQNFMQNDFTGFEEEEEEIEEFEEPEGKSNEQDVSKTYFKPNPRNIVGEADFGVDLLAFFKHFLYFNFSVHPLCGEEPDSLSRNRRVQDLSERRGLHDRNPKTRR